MVVNMIGKKPFRHSGVSSPALVKIGDVLPQLIARYGIHQMRNVEAMQTAWTEQLEEPFASATKLVGISRGTLQIVVPHVAFIQELSFREKELLQKMRTAFPEEKIKKIRYITE